MCLNLHAFSISIDSTVEEIAGEHLDTKGDTALFWG